MSESPSKIENVFYGVGRVVEKRYKMHKQNVVDWVVVPKLDGKPREIKEKLRPRLELAAKAAAVTATTTEIVGSVAALIGTALLLKKTGSKSTVNVPSLLARDQEWFRKVDWESAAKVGNIVKNHPAFIHGYHLSYKTMGALARELEIRLHAALSVR